MTGWLKLGLELELNLLKRVFVACGQVANAKIEDINCLKPGRPVHEALSLAKEMWELQSNEIDFINLKKKDKDSTESQKYMQ